MINPFDRTQNKKRQHDERRVVRIKVAESMDKLQNKYLLKPYNTDASGVQRASYKTHSSNDDRFELRSRVAAENNVSRNADGVDEDAHNMDVDEHDWQYVSEKREELEEESFENWFQASIDLSRQYNVDYAHRVLPEFGDRREEEVRLRIKLLEDLAMINLRGPQSKKDLLLLYAIKQGYIEQSIINMVVPPPRENEDELKPGMFNPRHAQSAVETMGMGAGGIGKDGSIKTQLPEEEGALDPKTSRLPADSSVGRPGSMLKSWLDAFQV